MTKMLSIMHQRIRSCVPFSARLVMSDCSFPVVGSVGTLPSPGRTFWLKICLNQSFGFLLSKGRLTVVLLAQSGVTGGYFYSM